MADDEQTTPEFLTTKEVARLLRVKERRVYDLAAAGDIPHRRATGKLLFPRRALEAWLGADAEVAAPPPLAAPVGDGAGGAPARPMVLAGSDDPLIDWAVRASSSGMPSFCDGSLDGLARFARGEACAALLHVFDPETDAWNQPAHLARLADGVDVARGAALIRLADRRQGLLRPAGAAARGLASLADARLARRQAAAGGRIYFEHALRAAGLAPERLTWSVEAARTEADLAEAVGAGRADAAFGLEAMARRHGRAFEPLVDAPFDLLIDRRAAFEPAAQRLFAFLRGEAFAERAGELGGYDLGASGSVVWNGP